MALNGLSLTCPAFAPLMSGLTEADFMELDKVLVDKAAKACGLASSDLKEVLFLLKARHGSGYTPPPPGGDQFGDVDASHWAVAWIEQHQGGTDA